MDYTKLTEQEHELAVSEYMQEHGLLNSENLPFNTLPFRQIVVMLRYLQNLLDVHRQDYRVPTGEELLYAVDTTALWVNHMLNDPSCWCDPCECKKFRRRRRSAAANLIANSRPTVKPSHKE
jgi:hypothetical protein